MTNKEYIQSVAAKSGVTIDEAKRLMSAMTASIVSQVAAGNSIVIHGLGSIEPKVKAERRMYNPNTKEYTVVPQKTAITFKMSATLKDRLNG